jgi:hypothetical protein
MFLTWLVKKIIKPSQAELELSRANLWVLSFCPFPSVTRKESCIFCDSNIDGQLLFTMTMMKKGIRNNTRLLSRGRNFAPKGLWNEIFIYEDP